MVESVDGRGSVFGLGLMVVFVMREVMTGATLPGLESRTDNEAAWPRAV